MIRGFFSSGIYEDKSYLVLSSFLECCHVVSSDSPEVSKLGNTKDTFKHIFSKDHSTGVVLGGIEDQYVFLSHLSCTGSGCHCAQVALNLLKQPPMKTSSEESASSVKRKLAERISPPFLVILVHKEQVLSMNAFTECDGDVLKLPSPNCTIR